MPTIHRLLVTLPATQAHREALEKAAPHAALRLVPTKALAPTDVESADVIIGPVPLDMLSGAKALKWLQLGSAGADGYSDAMPSGAQLTSATGAYGPAVAQHAFAMMLSLQKNLPLYRDRQTKAEWADEGPARSLYGNTVLIVGFGDIGQCFATLMRPFDSRILSISRTEKKEGPADERYASLAHLDALLPRADIVFLSLPGTHMTRHVLDARRIALLKPTAIVLNVGRGALIDTEALCDAAEAGRFLGAGLDVTDPEPLPPDHRLWSIKNILLTPHISGGFHLPETLDRIFAICVDNLIRYQKGAPLRNVIDPVLGYAANQPETSGA